MSGGDSTFSLYKIGMLSLSLALSARPTALLSTSTNWLLVKMIYQNETICLHGNGEYSDNPI